MRRVALGLTGVCVVLAALGAAYLIWVRPDSVEKPPLDRAGLAGPQAGEPAERPGARNGEAEVRVEPIPGGRSELVLVTLDSSSLPMPGVAVTLRSGRHVSEALTDAAGTVAFAGIADGDYAVRLRAPDRPELTTPAAIRLEAGERKEVTFQIGDFDLSISGRVSNREGTPLGGVTLSASRLEADLDENWLVAADDRAQMAVTDAGGHYEILGLEAGEYEVRSAPAGRYGGARKAATAGLDGVDFILVEGWDLRVHGRVLDLEGRPLEGVAVAPFSEGGSPARTAEDGLYSLDVFLAEHEHRVVLRFQLEGYRDARRVIRRADLGAAGEWKLDARLIPAQLRAVFAGAVTANSRAVAGETVRLESPSLQVALRTATDAAGSFSFPEVPPGDDYCLSVRPQGDLEDFVLRPVEVPPEGLELRVELEPLPRARLSGRMVTIDGEPVPRLHFRIRSLKALGRTIEVTGDDEGRFEADAVPAGALIFETRSRPLFTIRDVDLAPGSHADVVLLIDQGPFDVSGEVTDRAGAPLPRARVELIWHHRGASQRSSSHRETLSDASGRYRFAGVGRGTHKLRVSAPGYRSAQVAHEVGAGSGAAPAISLQPLVRRHP